MMLPTTGTAHLSPALPTSGDLPACLIANDVSRRDPLSAAAGWTVDAVARGIFMELVVPHLLEAIVEETLDVAERDVVSRAALGRHQLWVGDG